MALSAQSHQLALYDDPHSEYCAKVKVVLHHKGITWQTIPVAPCGGGSSTGSLPFKQHAPLGKIPALVVRTLQGPPSAAAAAGAGAGGGGDTAALQEVVLYESEVINEWLEEAYPDPPMMPQQPLLRAQARLVSRVHDLYLEPALRKLYPQVSPSCRNPSVVSAAGQEFLQHLQHLDQQLLAQHTRLAVSDTLTLADCGYPALLLYAQLLWPVLGLGQLDLQGRGLPRVAAWHAALSEEGAVVKVLQELRPAAQEWLDGKLGS